MVKLSLAEAPNATAESQNKTKWQEENNWLAVLVCVLCGVVSALQVVKVSIAAPFLIDNLSLNHTSIGSLGGVFSVMGMLGGIPIASIVLRTGLKHSLLLGMLFISVSSFIAPLLPSLWLLYSLRMVEGLGFILITVAAPTLVQSHVRPDYKNMAMSFWSCFMPAGIAVMMFVGPLFSDWRTVWLVKALIAAIAFLLACRYVPASAQHLRLITIKRLRALLRVVLGVPAAAQVTLIFSCYNLMYFAFYNFLPLLVVESLGLGHLHAGLITGFAAIANVGGNLLSGVLLSRGISRLQIFFISFATMAVMGGIIFAPEENPYWITLAALFFAGTGGMLPTAVLSSAPLVAPISFAIPITLGLYMQGSNLGQVLGPWVTGVGTDLFGWAVASPMFIVLGLLGLVLLFYRRLEL